MFIKDYTKFYPEGFNDDDVYVCESRYMYKVKVFKKYKVGTNWRLFPALVVQLAVVCCACLLDVDPTGWTAAGVAQEE